METGSRANTSGITREGQAHLIREPCDTAIANSLLRTTAQTR